MDATLQRFFSPCPRGLEAALVSELEGLGAHMPETAPGGVAFRGKFPLCYQVNLESRIASRVLWQIGHGRYRDEDDIYRAAYALPWSDWFDSGRSVMVKVSARKCPLRSLDFVTLRIKDALCDKLRQVTGARPSVDTRNPDVRVYAFLDPQHFTLYLDTSGPALFQRGLRQAAGEAPLRENLAAGILKLAGWAPGMPLLDPMCGSGTFLLEAAQMALDIAPGIGRGFGFEKLHNFCPETWQGIRAASLARQRPPTPQSIYGSDLSGTVLAAARTNLEAAGLLPAVQLKQANVLEIGAPAPAGVVVSNPPYGVRLGAQQQLAEFYPRLGDVLKKRFSGWQVYLLTADMALPGLMRLAPSRRTPLFNGPLECRLFEFKMVAGSARRKKPGSEDGSVPG